MSESREEKAEGPARRRVRRRRRLRLRSWLALRSYLLAGVLVTAPLFATFWLVWQFVTFVDRRVEPLIPDRFEPATYLPFAVPGLGLLLALIGLVLVGFFATSFAGRLLTRGTDAVLSRLPLVRGVYGWTKQVFETVLAHRSNAFRQVVLVEYPQRGVWVVGFVTGRTLGEVQELTAETTTNVFVPATPNVSTGFLLFVPEREIRPLDMTVEEGIKLVISGGIVAPASSPERTGEGLPPLDTEPAAEPEPPAPGARGRLRQYLFTGLIVTGPVGFTLWLVWTLVNFVDQQIVLLLPPEWRDVTELPFVVPGLGLLLLLVVLALVGMFATGFVGRALIRSGESLLVRMPIIRSIYGAFKHFFETVLSRRSGSFRKVVLFEYPRAGCWALGFVTGRTRVARDRQVPPSVHVYLPTTPNPTSGFLLFVPEEKMHVLSMTVEEGLKMVVSGGLVTPRPRPGRPDRRDPLRRVG